MGFDFASAKNAVRQEVHKTLGVQAFYQDNPAGALHEMSVRWSGKLVQQDPVAEDGWAVIAEGVDQVIFSLEQARSVGVKKDGIVRIPSMQDGLFYLDYRLPPDGPFKETWRVTRDVP